MTDDDVLVQNGALRSSRQVDGFTIMDPATGAYYALSETGAFIWECVQRPTSIAGVKESAAARYRVSIRDVGAQIDAFIAQMAAAGLVSLSNQTEGAEHATGMGPATGDQ
jgi:hypothetical protein